MAYTNIGDIVSGRPFASVSPETSLRDACMTLCQRSVSALAVVGETGLVGVLSEYDVIRRAICPSRPIAELTVADVMATQPITVECTTGTSEALGLMRSLNIRHLPVLDNGRPIGLLSVPDMRTIDRLMVERYVGFGQAA